LQGKATGGRYALRLRARLQGHLFQLGCSLHRHAGKVLFVGILVLATFCVGLKSAKVHTRVDQLWVEGKRLSVSPPWCYGCSLLSHLFRGQ
jgi:patched 1 protein